MTAVELAKLIGASADFEIKPGGMVVPVTIVDAKEAWSRVRVALRPVHASESSQDQWVELDNRALRNVTLAA